MRRMTGALAAATLLSGTALAAPEGFLDRFSGEWSGDGTLLTTENGAPYDISCAATGTLGETRLSLKGECRAALIFSREIALELEIDPDSGAYSGTYVGSKVGTAHMTGRREGESLKLDVTWPEDVNGDRASEMTITNEGDGGFQVTMHDRFGGDGPVATTTDIRFAKK